MYRIQAGLLPGKQKERQEKDMSKFQVAYIPVGVPTFHLESAQAEFEKSISLLQSLSDAVAVPAFHRRSDGFFGYH